MENSPQLIIIGAGPAGLTAAIYAGRAGFTPLIMEKLVPGGQIVLSDKIENFPGFSQQISTRDLMAEMQKQAEAVGIQLIQEEAVEIKTNNGEKMISTASGKVYRAPVVIIASGTQPKSLGVKGEKKFLGRGVSYCATCDAPFFKNETVAVIGGGNTAVEETLYLTRFARKVYLIHRRGMLRAEKILQERALSHQKIDLILKSVISEIYGEESVEGIRLLNKETGETTQLNCKGVFMFVGLEPNTQFLAGQLKLNRQGFIKTGENLETNIPGIFACGDVRENLLKQVVVACGEGALAGFMAGKYLDRLSGQEYLDTRYPSQL